MQMNKKQRQKVLENLQEDVQKEIAIMENLPLFGYQSPAFQADLLRVYVKIEALVALLSGPTRKNPSSPVNPDG